MTCDKNQNCYFDSNIKDEYSWMLKALLGVMFRLSLLQNLI
jgi:hypothetical protein